MRDKQLTQQKAQSEYEIDSLIKFLNLQKSRGATHCRWWWSKDPMWGFEWFETFRKFTEDEIKADHKADLQKQIDEL